MTSEEYVTFEKELKDKGYVNFPSSNNANWSFYKGFGESVVEPASFNYQICFDVYDIGDYEEKYIIEFRIYIKMIFEEHIEIINKQLNNIEEAERFANHMFIAYKYYN